MDDPGRVLQTLQEYFRVRRIMVQLQISILHSALARARELSAK